MTLVEQEVDRFPVAEAGPGTADAVVEAEAVDAVVEAEAVDAVVEAEAVDAVVIFEIEAAVGM